MSAGITGTQPHTTNDNNQANGNHAQPSQSEANPPQHQLTPDRPPHPVDSGEPKPKRPRGFAAMDRKLGRERGSAGGGPKRRPRDAREAAQGGR
jgi:hypothetical protein